jgi:hypothetical protein
MGDVTIDTGTILQWADKMEKRGADFAAEVVKSAKGSMERKRREGRLKFVKIKRAKSGNKRFAIQKPPSQAELINAERPKFTDVFKEK